MCASWYTPSFTTTPTPTAALAWRRRHNEAVNMEAGHGGAKMGGKMNPFGDKFDGRGNRLTAKQRSSPLNRQVGPKFPARHRPDVPNSWPRSAHVRR